jgi:hypothetical protein
MHRTSTIAVSLLFLVLCANICTAQVQCGQHANTTTSGCPDPNQCKSGVNCVSDSDPAHYCSVSDQWRTCMCNDNSTVRIYTFQDGIGGDCSIPGCSVRGKPVLRDEIWPAASIRAERTVVVRPTGK